MPDMPPSIDAIRGQISMAFAHSQLMLQRLDGELNMPWLNVLQARTRVPRVYIFLGILLFGFAFLFLGFGAAFFSALIGFAYPAYASFKAIEASSAANVKHDAAQWLMYWVVFSVFSLVESLTGGLLFSLPFYDALKVAFLLYLQVPVFRGAEVLYSQFLRPVFLRNQPTIDAQFERLQGASSALRNVIGFDPLRPAEEAGSSGAAASGMPGQGVGAPAAEEDIAQIFGAHPPGAGAAVVASDGAGSGLKRRD